MCKNNNLVSILLAGVLSMILLVLTVVRTCAPSWILPEADIPNLVLVSLVPLLLEARIAPKERHSYLLNACFAAAVFGLLPYAAGFAAAWGAAKLAILGSLVFTLTTWLFDSIRDRLASCPPGKAAPFLNALGLYLAAQCFGGLL